MFKIIKTIFSGIWSAISSGLWIFKYFLKKKQDAAPQKKRDEIRKKVITHDEKGVNELLDDGLKKRPPSE